MPSSGARIHVLALGTFAVAAGLGAQEGPNTVELSLSNPGARSLGLGGAFAALADDATAAFANPAGLVQLIEPEVSIEGRVWSYSTPFTAGGRAVGPPTGILLDDAAGLRIGESSEDVSDISFLSLVYPRKKFSLAFYRHQLANFEATTETQGLFAGDVPGFPDTARDLDRRSTTDFEVVAHGVAGGYRLTERFSLGLGIAHVDLELLAQDEEFRSTSLFGSHAFPAELRVLSSDFAAGGGDWAFHAGFLWHLSERWNLGGFYRRGVRVAAQLEVVTGPLFEPPLPAGTRLSLELGDVGLPDVFGLGWAYRSGNGALTVSFEWDRVEYSDTIDRLDPDLFEGITLEDGDELHLGFEYVFSRSTPIVALRLGAWRDPDHRIRDRSSNIFDRALFTGGEDELHLAAGVGLVFEAIQIDLGVDFSDLIDTASLSAIYSF